jgi:catechol 2,3-dioxygenase-like lactoylglutathione lyase family enzyme
MSGLRLDHIALTVESLRQAENFYTRLFGLKVLFREGVTGDGWKRCPEDWAWEQALMDGLHPERSCLGCGDLRLMLLMRSSEYTPEGRIDYVCLQLHPEESCRLIQKAKQMGCEIEKTPNDTSILDPYGVRWRLRNVPDCSALQ